MTGLFATLVSAATGQDTPLSPRVRNRFERGAQGIPADAATGGDDQTLRPLPVGNILPPSSQPDRRGNSVPPLLGSVIADQPSGDVPASFAIPPLFPALRSNSPDENFSTAINGADPSGTALSAATALSIPPQPHRPALTGTDNAAPTDAQPSPPELTAPHTPMVLDDPATLSTLLPPTASAPAALPSAQTPGGPPTGGLHLAIGRIEVRPPAPPPAAMPRPAAVRAVLASAVPRAAPRQTLDDYRARRRS